MIDIYKLSPDEDNIAYFHSDFGRSDFEYFKRILLLTASGKSISGIWNSAALMDNLQKIDGEGVDFTCLIAGVTFPLLTERALSFSIVEKFLAPFGEFLPLTVTGKKMYAYNCLRLVHCVHPELKFRSCYPFFYRELVPKFGMFRVPNSSGIYGVDSGTDGFKHQFYVEGLMGWRFKPVEILDEEPAPALKKKAAAAKRNHK